MFSSVLFISSDGNEKPVNYCFSVVVLLKWLFISFLKASIHMPRIGYQDGSDRSEWYTVERLLRKYASIYNVKVYVYVFSLLRFSHNVVVSADVI